MEPSPTATLSTLRRFLLALFLAGILGTGTELLLLGHTEDTWQLVPLGLMAASLVVLAWHGLARRRLSLRIFQTLMLFFVLSGFAGLLLHYQANVEFELEMYPSRKGLELFWEAITGAMPALAPGTMTGLGLLGLAFTYRHPALSKPSHNNATIQGETP
jgi:hypothetical protein